MRQENPAKISFDISVNRDFRLFFPFLKWEFGGRPCDLLGMICQGQTFLCPLRTLISKKLEFSHLLWTFFYVGKDGPNT